MMRHTSLLVVAFAMLATPAAGSPISYTFSGDGELAGGFILDDEADWDIETGTGGTFGALSSPLHTFWGTFGEYEFKGIPTLHVWQYADRDYATFDYWIVRSPITFSSAGSPAIAHVNLFVYGFGGMSLTPRLPSSPSQFDFQYAVAFDDGSFVTSPLQSLVKVSEPPSFVLPFLAFAAIVAARFVAKA